VRLVLPVLEIVDVVPHVRRRRRVRPAALHPEPVGEAVVPVAPVQAVQVPVHERPLLGWVQRALQVVQVFQVHALLLAHEPLEAALLQEPVRVQAQVQLEAVAAVHVQALVQPQVDVALPQAVPQRAQRVDGALQVRVVGVVLQQHRRRLVEVQPSAPVLQPALQLNYPGDHRRQLPLQLLSTDGVRSLLFKRPAHSHVRVLFIIVDHRLLDYPEDRQHSTGDVVDYDLQQLRRCVRYGRRVRRSLLARSVSWSV
jgi:hypothetical protein